jgi:hypothetical protein
MKRLIKYFTPVGEEQKGFVMAFVIVISIILSIVFLFPLLTLLS